MDIFVASLRNPKIDAVKCTFERLGPLLIQGNVSIDVIPMRANVRTTDMPLSLEDLMSCAFARVNGLLDEVGLREQTYYVGLEGGLFSQGLPVRKSNYFLQSWAYVSNGKLGFWGASPAVPVPGKVLTQIVKAGSELGDVIDMFGEQTGIRDKGGAFSVFTRGQLTRQQSFESALTGALAAFYNPELYA